MKLKISLKNAKLSVENSAGEPVLDVAYDSYDATIDLSKGAEAVTELLESFGKAAAQIEAAASISH
jgi:hypothetical protein